MKEGDQVHLVIGKNTPLGYVVLIEETHEGLLYSNEVFTALSEGDKIVGYIKKIREDGKIDVSLTPQGYKNVIAQLADKILQSLKDNNGVLQLSDKSSPEDIKSSLQMSKKNFKKAIGYLYKQKKITLSEKAIYSIKNKPK